LRLFLFSSGKLHRNGNLYRKGNTETENAVAFLITKTEPLQDYSDSGTPFCCDVFLQAAQELGQEQLAEELLRKIERLATVTQQFPQTLSC
jgi:hypothetical protein